MAAVVFFCRVLSAVFSHCDKLAVNFQPRKIIWEIVMIIMMLLLGISVHRRALMMRV